MKLRILMIIAVVGIGMALGNCYAQEVIRIKQQSAANGGKDTAGGISNTVIGENMTAGSKSKERVSPVSKKDNNQGANSRRILLLISEQNIEGPRTRWWLSEVDLSATEAAIARRLIARGYEIIDPSVMDNIIKQKPAFRYTDLSNEKPIELGNLSGADYVIVGKAVASAGSKVISSNLTSYFANISARLVRVKDGKIIGYLSSSGKSVHMDPITGGKNALIKAADNLAPKIINILNNQ